MRLVLKLDVDIKVDDLLQIYSQNSLRPARLKQSMPRMVAVAPAKDVDPIRPYGRVRWLIYKAGAPTVKQEMKTIFPVVLEIVPPALRVKIHIAKQKPPRKQLTPSVISLKRREPPPAMTPVRHAATK